MCCTRLAGNTGRKNDAKNRHLHTIAQLYQAISSQLRHTSTIGKNLLSSNISPTCPYNVVNFDPLAAEIASLVWGTPAIVFRVLAALLHSQTVALNRGRHLYSTGRPSRWALAHISSLNFNAISVHNFTVISGFGYCYSITPQYCKFKMQVWNLLHAARWKFRTQKLVKLECGPMPNLMVALPNIGGALCSTPQSLADAHY